VRADQGLRERPPGVVADQGAQRQLPHVLVGVGQRLDEQGLGRPRVLLDQGLDREPADVGILRAEGRLQRGQFLVLGDRGRERLLAQRRLGVVVELQQQVPRPGLLDLGQHLGQHLLANVGVNALEDEAQRVQAAPGHVEVQRGLERLLAYARGAVVEGAGEQLQGRAHLRGVAGGFPQEADEGFEAAAAHVLEGGVQPRGRGVQRLGGLEPGQRGEGRVTDGGLRVVQQRPQPVAGPRVFEGGQRPADLDARRRVLLAAQLQ
jgi:hypothetical protein